MKKLNLLILISIFFWSACNSSSSDENETDTNDSITNGEELNESNNAESENLSVNDRNTKLLTKLLAAMETHRMPIAINGMADEIKVGGEIEIEYLPILPDTVAKEVTHDGQVFHETDYYYYGKIPTEGKDFEIIILGERSSTIGDEEDQPMSYTLCTYSKTGTIIASVLFAREDWSMEDGDDTKEGQLSGMINNSLNIKIRSTYSSYFYSDRKETHHGITTEYQINDDGTITETNKEKEEIPKLLMTFWELSNYDEFRFPGSGSTNYHNMTQYLYGANEQYIGYEVIKSAPDFIRLDLFCYSINMDEVIFQLLETTEEYDLFVYCQNGENQVPPGYGSSSLHLFKRSTYGEWEEYKIDIFDGSLVQELSGIYVYSPNTKTLNIYNVDESDDEGALFYNKGLLQNSYQWTGESFELKSSK